jgi:hypothetical protein
VTVLISNGGCPSQDGLDSSVNTMHSLSISLTQFESCSGLFRIVMRITVEANRAMYSGESAPAPKESAVKKIFRSHADQPNCTVLLIGFVMMGFFGFHDWLIDDRKYLIDGAFALAFLAAGLFNLWRWYQRQVRITA